MKGKYKTYFWISFIIGTLLIAYTLSPSVLAYGKSEPYIVGLPYTFGMSLIMSFVVLVVTLIAAYFLQESIKEN